MVMSVLQIIPGTGEVSTLGDGLHGKYKWLRAVRAGDGTIYGIPAFADSVLRIDPATGEVRTAAVCEALVEQGVCRYALEYALFSQTFK
jgi:hypothetical protein